VTVYYRVCLFDAKGRKKVLHEKKNYNFSWRTCELYHNVRGWDCWYELM
jgi:hypothetical protein